MDPIYIDVGDTVQDSGVGPGTVTGFYKDFPQVNGKAVGRLTRTDGAVFGPNGTLRLPEGVAPALIPAAITGLGLPKQSWNPPAAPVAAPAVAVQDDAPLAPLEVSHDSSDDDVEGGTPLDTTVGVPTGNAEVKDVADDSSHN